MKEKKLIKEIFPEKTPVELISKVPPVRGNVIDQVFSPNTEQHKTDNSEDVAMIIREWLAKKHINMKTRYNKRQVLSVTTLQSLANTYKIMTLHRFLTEFRTSKLSEDGKSSSELENILVARMPQEEDLELKKLSRFLE